MVDSNATMPAKSVDRNEVFDLAFRFVSETNENIFLTGKAGTGKTTFLKYLKEHCSKNMIVAAPTGVAAINAGGVTLHSLFQLPFHPFLPTAAGKSELLGKMKFNRRRQEILRKLELLIIDEISMVRCDTVDAIDTILRSVRRAHDLPFGGVQLLCIGDFYQLPPVAQRHEWTVLQEYYSSEFFFDSYAVKEQMPILIELNKIYRQKDDSFVYLLNQVRNNQMNADDFEDLHQRYLPNFRPGHDENYITLTSHNNQADVINARELHQLPAGPVTYHAAIEDDFPESMYPAEGELILKAGAQVMFLKNDTVERKYFNGKIGIVKSLTLDEIIVESDGVEINVAKETWENLRYSLNREDGKLEQEVLGTFTQFPLRLAWAITIHKSQGLTFEKVMIDAGAAFSSGQVYVALSRCTSLAGIVLLSKIPAAAIYSNEQVISGQKTLTPKGSLAERFEGARQIFTLHLLEEIFSFDPINTLLNVLSFQINEQMEKLNSDAVKWINELKNSFTDDRNVGLKFITHAAALMKQCAVIENNLTLQKRIIDAANYFLPKFTTLQHALQNHPLITEHRETAHAVDEYLNQLLPALHLQNYYLAYCKEPFSVTAFLKYKMNYELPHTKLSSYASGKKQSGTDVANRELFDKLKQWRDTMADENNLPIYMVANQNALKEITTYLPFTKKELMQLSGFGKARADKYGDDILDFVRDYCSRNGVSSNMAAKEVNSKRVRKATRVEEKTPTNILSFNLFTEGKSIAEIAKERNMTTGTIEGHLAPFVASKQINIDVLVSAEKQELVKEAVKRYGKESFKTLKENLPESISYGELKLVLAAEL